MTPRRRGRRGPRGPYGRRPDSFPLITDPDVMAHRAEDFDGARDIPMPRGGVRWLVRCRKCGAWRKTLYTYVRSGVYWCRVCWGLRYPSQYSGRRPEASPQRQAALLEAAGRARSPEVRERRYERYAQAVDAFYGVAPHHAVGRVRPRVPGDARLMSAPQAVTVGWNRKQAYGCAESPAGR